MISPESLTPIQKYLRKDYFMSFMHSQGNYHLQHSLFWEMALFYKQELGPEAGTALSGDVSWLYFGSVPERHLNRPSAQASVIADAETMAATLTQETARAFRAPRRTKPQAKVDATVFARELIETDLRYQRKLRGVSSDQHMSYFRTFVLLERPTGCDSLDHAYETLREMLPQIDIPYQLSELTQKWTKNHDGEAFFPSEASVQTQATAFS